MPPTVAALLFFAFTVYADRVVRLQAPTMSAATWIPFFWIVIAGSRPITAWLDPSGISDPSTLLEGSPVDRLLYQSLIALSVAVLIGRRMRMGDAVGSNLLLGGYFLYLLLGTLWSDYSEIALRRWVKDFGNILVLLVLVTERDQIAAARTVMVRVAVFVIPANVLLIKYFPEMARNYDFYTGRVFFTGAALDKNMLGMALVALLGFVGWAFLENMRTPRSRNRTIHQGVCLLLIGLAGWVLSIADSATAVACALTGAALHLVLMNAFARRHVVKIGVFGALAAVTIVATGLLDEIMELVASSLGRDPSLTGRDAIWRILLLEDINPVLGAGSYTFWMPERSARLSEGYMAPINSAHNGFLDVYLDSGLIGVGLLICVLLSGILRFARALRTEDSRWSAQSALVFMIVCGVYASTEAIFNRLDLLWIGLLVCMLCVAPRLKAAPLQSTIPAELPS
jgi:exopolysaccharide production protein ExoQ